MSQFYDPKNEYTVPYGAGIPLIVYDPGLTDVKITGYEDLWNPALENNVALTANYRVIDGITLKTMGESFNTEDLDVIRAAVEGLENYVNLEEADCYEVPEITSENEELKALLEKMQKYAGISITYTFGENKEVLDGPTISSWLHVDGFEVELDTAQVENYVATLRKKYDTIFRPRTFMTSYGQEVTIDGGDYGWWMNYDKEAEELEAMIEKGESGERTPVYYQTAASYGTPDYGTTYVEINLTAQHLFFYQDGKLMMESDFVSGNSAKGYDTPAGVYSIPSVSYTHLPAKTIRRRYPTGCRSIRISACMMQTGDPALAELFTRQKDPTDASICRLRKHRKCTVMCRKEHRSSAIIWQARNGLPSRRRGHPARAVKQRILLLRQIQRNNNNIFSFLKYLLRRFQNRQK